MQPDCPCAIYVWARRDPSDPAGGVVYFGITAKPENRLKFHLWSAAGGRGYALHRAIRKYGVAAFERRLFWLPSRAEAARQEQNWIAEAERRGVRTYNLTSGGDDIGTLKPEVLARRTASITATQNRPEVRARRSEISKASWAKPDVRARIHRATQKALADPEVLARRNASIKVALNRPEVKAKRSAAIKAACASPEARARLTAAGKAAGAAAAKKHAQRRIDEAPLLDQISDLYGQGLGRNRIAKALNLSQDAVKTRLGWLRDAGRLPSR